jgi:hypothetical protein
MPSSKIVQLGLKLMYGERGARGISLQAGRAWWGGKSPIDYTFWKAMTLDFRLLNTVVQRTHPMFLEKEHQETGERIFALLDAFGKAFEVEIGTQITTQKTDGGFEIHLANCPFCLSRHPDTCKHCQVSCWIPRLVDRIDNA